MRTHLVLSHSHLAFESAMSLKILTLVSFVCYRLRIGFMNLHYVISIYFLDNLSLWLFLDQHPGIPVAIGGPSLSTSVLPTPLCDLYFPFHKHRCGTSTIRFQKQKNHLWWQEKNKTHRRKIVCDNGEERGSTIQDLQSTWIPPLISSAIEERFHYFRPQQHNSTFT